MTGNEIFNEILKSPQLKELLNVPEGEEIDAQYDVSSPHQEITVIRNIIEGQIRHTSDDAIFKGIKKIYDL